MKRRFTFAAVLAMVLLPLVAAVAAASPASVYSYNFNKTLLPWKPAGASSAFVTDDTLKLKNENGTTPLTIIPVPPNGYAALHQHGGQPVWMMAYLPTTASRISVEFDIRDFGGCAGCVPLLYAGTSAPTSRSQFKTDYMPVMASRWSTHVFNVTIPGASDPRPTTDAGAWPGVWVAISYTPLDKEIYARDMYAGIDNVTVRFYDAW